MEEKCVLATSELNQLKESTLKQSLVDEESGAAELVLMTTERDELQQQLYQIVEQLNQPHQLPPSDAKNGMNQDTNEAMTGDEAELDASGVGSPTRPIKRFNHEDVESSPASSTNSSSDHLISLVEFQDIYDSPGCKSPVETYANNPLRMGGKPLHKPAAAMRQLSYGAAQRVAELQGKLAAQTKMLTKRQDEMNQLNEQIASLQSQLTAATAGSDELVQQLQGRVTELETDTESKDKESVRLNEQLASLQSQLASASSQGDERVHQLQTRLAALETESTAAAAEHSKAQDLSKEMTGKMMEKLKELKVQLDEKSQAVVDLTAQVSSLQAASEEQAAQAAKAENEEIARLNGQIASLQSQLSAATAGSDELVQQLQGRVTELETDAESNGKESARLNEQLASLQSQLASASSQGDERVHQLQTQLAALETESTAAAAEHSKAQDLNKEMAGKMMEKVKELKAQLDEKNQTVVDLTTQVSSLQAASEDQAAQAAKATDDEVARLNGQIASLQSQLTAATAGSDELVQQLQGRVTELETVVESKGKEAVLLNKQLVSLENQLKEQLVTHLLTC